MAALRALTQSEEVPIDPEMNKAAYAACVAAREALGKPITLEVTPDLNQTALLGVEAQLAVLKAQSAIREAESIGGSAVAGAAGGAAGGGGGGLLTALGYGGGSILGAFTALGNLFSAKFGSILSLAGFGPEHLLTTGIGLAGSAAGAGIGAGLLGLGSLGVSGVGLATDAAGMGQAAGDARTYTADLNALNKAIAVYGKGSLEAASAQYQLNQDMAGLSPQALKAVKALSSVEGQFHSLFDKFTSPAEAKGANILSGIVKTAEAFLPTIGKFASQNMTIIGNALKPLESWMKGPGLGYFNVLEKKFQSDLPTAMQAFTQGLELLLRTLAFIAPYTGRLIHDLARLTTEANGSDWGKFSGWITKMIGLFRTWSKFIVILVKDIADLFGLTAGLGSGIITELTGYLEQLHTALQSTGKQSNLGDFFQLHKQEILQLIELFVHFGTSVTKAYLAIAPALISIAVLVLRVVNAMIDLVQHIPGGSMALGFIFLAGKMGILLPLLVGAGKDATLLQKAISGLGEASGLHKLVSDLKTMGSVLLSEMGDKAKKAFSEFATNAKVGIGRGTTAMKGWATSAGQSLTGFVTVSKTRLGKFATDAKSAATRAGTALKGWAQPGITALSTFASQIKTKLEPLATQARTVAGKALGAIKGFASNAATAIAGLAAKIKTTKLWTALISGLSGVGNAIKGLVVKFGTLVLGEEAVAAATNGVSFATKALMATSLLAIVAVVYELYKHLGLLRTALIVLAAAIAIVTTAVIAFDIAAAPEEVLLILLEIAVVGLIAALVLLGYGIYELATHWRQAWAFIKEAAVDAWHLIDDVIHWIINLFAGAQTWLVEAGKDILLGLVHGIEGGAKAAVDAVKHIGHDIISGIKSVLGVFSPSKITMQAGKDTTAGLTLGISAGSAAAVGAAKKVSSQIISAFGSLGQTSKIASSVKGLEGIFSGLAGTFTNLDTAASKAAGIKTDLTQIGSGMSTLASHIPALSGDLDKVNTAFTKIGGNKTLSSVGTHLSVLGGVFVSFGKMASASGQVTGAAVLRIIGALQLLEQASGPIKTSIGGVVNSFHKLDTSKTVIPQLTQLGKVFSNLGGLFNSMASIAKTSASLTVTAINNIIGVLWNLDAKAPLIRNAIKDLEGQMSKLGSLKKVNKELSDIGTLFGNLATVLGNLSKAAASAASLTPKSIGDIGKAFSDLKLVLGGLPADIESVSSTIISDFTNLATDSQNALNPLPASVKAASALVVGDMNTLQSGVRTAGTNTASSFRTLASGVQSILSNQLVNDVRTFVTSVTTSFNQLPGAVNSVRGQVVGDLTTFQAQVHNTLSPIPGIVNGIGTATRSALANLFPSSAVSAAVGSAQTLVWNVGLTMNQIPGVVANVGPAASAAAYGVANGMVGTINGFYGDFYSAGASLMEGLSAGINSAAGAVGAAAAAAASNALASAKAASKSHSPSLLFAELGYDWGLGLVQGLNSAKSVIANAANTVIPSSVGHPGSAVGGAGGGITLNMEVNYQINAPGGNPGASPGRHRRERGDPPEGHAQLPQGRRWNEVSLMPETAYLRRCLICGRNLIPNSDGWWTPPWKCVECRQSWWVAELSQDARKAFRREQLGLRPPREPAARGHSGRGGRGAGRG